MLYALGWFFVSSLLAMWSLAVWAMHAVAVWTVSNAGALTGVASEAQSVRLPEWLAPWVPPEIAQVLPSLVADVAPVVESLLQAAPAPSGGLTMVAWVVWGIGSVLLLLLGAGLHFGVAMWLRRGGGTASLRGFSLKDIFR